MNDIREAIDALDETIISLIGKRAEYVDAAAKYKTDLSSVKASDRVYKMMIQRREWAEKFQLAPDFIEQLYQNIVQYFIQRELNSWEEKTKSS